MVNNYLLLAQTSANTLYTICVDKLLFDNSVFAIIHAASNYMCLEKLSREFICPFVLGDPTRCVYIVDIQNICEPLFAFRNYGKSGSHYFCSLPYRRWGTYFQQRIK